MPAGLDEKPEKELSEVVKDGCRTAIIACNDNSFIVSALPFEMDSLCLFRQNSQNQSSNKKIEIMDILVWANTFNAHRLIQYAKTAGIRECVNKPLNLKKI